MKFNNACSWKGCNVHKTDCTTQIVLPTPKLFLCDIHLEKYNKILKNSRRLTFGKIQNKRYLKSDET